MRSSSPQDGWKVLIKAFLIAAAVLLVADTMVTRSWPSALTEPADRPHHFGDAIAEGGRSRSSAIYYWRGALMGPSAADAAASDRPRQRLGRRGMMVASVLPGSPAARAKLKPGDIMVGFDGFPITTPGSLALAIADHGDGPTVSLRVWRRSRGGTATVSLLVPPDHG